MPKSVCVYCGSRFGSMPAYRDAAEALGRAIAQEGWQLVYGGADVGLMGTLAKAAQEAGGETFGVMPAHLIDMEIGKRDLTHFVVTQTMHERKNIMLSNADAVVLMPGGAGSLEEMFETLTWRQLGLHRKPICILNTNGFWSPLLALVDHIIDQGFADASLRDFLETEETPESLMVRLRDRLG
ncbi:MAG: TIGR00730 family Rossman fold protein [Pseudomonadota bacterium]